MLSLADIARRNEQTFYDFNSEKAQSTRWRKVSAVVAGAVLALTFQGPAVDFLTAVLTVQAILVGFSFSVLFFLLSDDPRPITPKTIEQGIRVDRLRRLSSELFYNVSYFNVVAVLSVLVAFILLLPMGLAFSIPPTSAWPQWLQWLGKLLHEAAVWWLWPMVGLWTRCAAFWLLYVLLIESLFTFGRTVVRVSFFFEQRLSLKATNADEPEKE